MLGETDLDVASLALAPGMRLTSMMAPSLVLGEGGVELVLARRGRRASARRSCRSSSRRSISGLPLQEAVELPRVHPEGDALDCEGGIPAETLDALETAGEQVVRWPGRNIYFGGAQVVARHSRGLRGCGRSAPRRHGRRRPTRAGGERTADCLRSRCDDRTRLFDHPRVRSTLRRSGSTPGPRSSASGLEGPADRVGDRRLRLPDNTRRGDAHKRSATTVRFQEAGSTLPLRIARRSRSADIRRL